MKPHDFAPRHLGTALAAAAVLLVGSLALHGAARADIDVRLDLGNAPALPGFYFNAPPHRVYDATSGVYVIDDPDVGDMDAFQYGGYYWVFRDGYWYRSADWRNGFEVVQPQYVPTQLYSVPAERWHHHPSYDSWHYRGWHTRDWQDRANVSTTRDREWNDQGQVYRAPTTTTYDRNRTYDQNRTYDRNGTYDRNRSYNGSNSQGGYYDSNGTYHAGYTQTRYYRVKSHHGKVKVSVHKTHHDYDPNRDDNDRSSY